ncbi:MAG TPA: SRPBCC family protein, partial [Solirubrobacterales bacterium]
MKPVTVFTVVARPVAEVYEFLDVLANHAGFMDHMLINWKFSGPERGVGARAEAKANTIGSQDWTDFEIVEADPPNRIVEEGIGNGGKRHTRGTYRLEELPDRGTKISFELEWLKTARAERLIPPMTRAFIHRVNAKSMRRLA